MDASKINTDELVISFQKLGEAHRSLNQFIKNNKSELNKSTLTIVTGMLQDLEKKQQEMIDFAFDSLFRKKGKKQS